MKQTPDKEILKLENVKTGKTADFEFRVKKVTPWLLHLVDERDQLSESVSRQYNEYQEAIKADASHKVPASFTKDSRRLKAVKNEIITLLIQPVGGYKSDDETTEVLPYIESDVVMDALLELFFSRSQNTTGSAKEYRQRLQETKAKIRPDTNA